MEQSGKKTICLNMIVKNESHIMKEWLQHYIQQGVDYFFLIDNGSNDNYMDAINTFADKIHLIIDPLPGHQTFLYNHHFLELLCNFL